MTVTELDLVWMDRAAELSCARDQRQWEIIGDDYYWQPEPGETELEIRWDKARLDAVEYFGKIIVEHGPRILQSGDKSNDTYAIARLTAENVLDSFSDDSKHVSEYPLPSQIITYNYGMLNAMLSRITGIDDDGMVKPLAEAIQ